PRRSSDLAVDRHAGGTVEDDEERAAGVALVDDHVPFREAPFTTLGSKAPQVGVSNRGEQRRPRKLLLQPVLSAPRNHNFFNARAGPLVPVHRFGFRMWVLFGYGWNAGCRNRMTRPVGTR